MVKKTGQNISVSPDDAKLLNKITGVYGGVSKDTPRVKIELRSEV